MPPIGVGASDELDALDDPGAGRSDAAPAVDALPGRRLIGKHRAGHWTWSRTLSSWSPAAGGGAAEWAGLRRAGGAGALTE